MRISPDCRPDELHLLDEGTRKAERYLTQMARDLDRINTRLDAAFAQLRRVVLPGLQTGIGTSSR